MHGDGAIAFEKGVGKSILMVLVRWRGAECEEQKWFARFRAAIRYVERLCCTADIDAAFHAYAHAHAHLVTHAAYLPRLPGGWTISLRALNMAASAAA
jgi:hypothetical protein